MGNVLAALVGIGVFAISKSIFHGLFAWGLAWLAFGWKIGGKSANNREKDFDDPKPMQNQQLLAAIAGQADWLEKMSSAPIESQNSPSIVEIAKKRRGYIARLCLELLSRETTDDEIYPGESKGPRFPEAVEYAKELEGGGVSKDNAAVRAVKEKLFVPSGVIYSTRWEV